MRGIRLSSAVMGALVGLLLAMAGGSGARAQTPGGVLPRSVGDAVSADAAARAGVPADGVMLLRFVAVTWNDGCLGLGGPNEACTQALVDGYVVWVLAGNTVYRYHTDGTGAAFRLAPATTSRAAVQSEPLPPGATDRTREQDRERLHRLVSGTPPVGGGFALVVFGGGTSEQLRLAAGCGPVLPMTAAFWATVGGEFVTYVPAAQVAVVNARWHEEFRYGIPVDTPLLMRCL